MLWGSGAIVDEQCDTGSCLRSPSLSYSFLSASLWVHTAAASSLRDSSHQRLTAAHAAVMMLPRRGGHEPCRFTALMETETVKRCVWHFSEGWECDSFELPSGQCAVIPGCSFTFRYISTVCTSRSDSFLLILKSDLISQLEKLIYCWYNTAFMSNPPFKT